MAEIDRESYFDLSVSDQADLLQSLAPMMGRRAEILEKDIWLCQVLDILFQLPCRKPMAFKGGTSSKNRGQTTVFCRCPCPSAGCRYPHLSRERLREVVEVV